MAEPSQNAHIRHGQESDSLKREGSYTHANNILNGEMRMNSVWEVRTFGDLPFLVRFCETKVACYSESAR